MIRKNMNGTTPHNSIMEIQNNSSNNIMDSFKSILLILVGVACVSCVPKSKAGLSESEKKCLIWIVDKFSQLVDAHTLQLAPEIAGDWVADDGSRVRFHENQTVEFIEFIQIRDSAFHEKQSDITIDSLRHQGRKAWAWHMELTDTIHYATGKWHWDIGPEISCRSDELCLGQHENGCTSFHYKRSFLPPFEIKYIYDIIGDPDEARYHKLYREQ